MPKGVYPHKKRRFCINGHDTLIMGRYANDACKACDTERKKGRKKYTSDYNKKYRKKHKDKINKQHKCIMREFNQQHPSFVNFDAMLARCYKPTHHQFKNYGGRGIKVYEPWKDFETYEREFGYLKPGPGYTVNRIDNDSNYEPGNVEWVTRSENAKKRFKKGEIK